MHSLEYIRYLNDKCVQKRKAWLEQIDKCNDIATLKKWLREAAPPNEAPACHNCGSRNIH